MTAGEIKAQMQADFGDVNVDEYLNGGETAIKTVKAAQNSDAPIYNLAGQKVSKAYKGIAIQNGKKFVVK
jgi:hypothetical protein